MRKTITIPKPIQYFLLSVFLWVIVDFGTAGGFRISYYEKIWPVIWLFYLGFPLIFSILIFRLKWNSTRLFLSTLVTIFIVEILFTRNPLLMTLPNLLWATPLAVLIYIPLVYFPLWFIRKELSKHRLMIFLSGAAVVVVTFLTISG
jgi:hypothetical protein